MASPSVYARSRSGIGVAFGPLVSCGRAAAKLGGEPPPKVLLFPAGRWTLAEGDSLITDAESFRSVIANFEQRGVLVVFDYEHMTIDEFRKPGELPIAAGFITSLEVTDDGLVGSVTWTDKAAQHIAAGEYLYHSPVAIYDKNTRRVIALHSCALTNTPRTNDQKPITEQVAAKIIAACWPEEKGGEEMQWIDLLMQFLSGRFDSTAEQKIATLEALIQALRTVDSADAVAAASASGEESILAHLRLRQADDAVPASDAVTAALGLEARADTTAVVARIGEMKIGVVPKADHEAIVASLRDELAGERAKVSDLTARLDAATTSDVETLIAANLDRLSPALRHNIRTVAKTDRQLAVEMIANITGSRVATVMPPAPIAGTEPAGAPSAIIARIEVSTPRTWRGQALPVSEDSGSIAAAVRAIQNAERCDYPEASRRYHARLQGAPQAS
jgi:phage I-like protein